MIPKISHEMRAEIVGTQAASALTQAAAEAELRPKLDVLIKKVADLAVEAQALKPGVLTKLNEAVKEVDALLNR